jgi:hypothetical protein
VYIWLIKTNANGYTLWMRKIGEDSGYAQGPIEQLDDGGYIITGNVARGSYDCDVYLVRTDSNGDTLWTRAFGGSNLDMGSSVQATSDGGFIIGGQTLSFGAGNWDFYLIKTDANGNAAVAEPKKSPPRRAVLSLACAPNPFSGSTKISLSAQVSGSVPVSLRVYDVQGRLVRTIAASRISPTIWDGRDDAGRRLPSGTYSVHCVAPGKQVTARLVLQR